MRLFRNVALLPAILFFLPPLLLAQQHPAQISEDEIEKHFSKAPDCEGVDIDSLEYFDFLGDGNEEAIVVASTCATGTAGPDVHAVVRRQPDGSLAELKIPEPTEKQYSVLFGRIFYELSVKNGVLIETYDDESGRTDPLVIKFRWSASDHAFQIVEAKTAPRYKTSFDCDQAKTGVENAICYSSKAASLDLALQQTYKAWLDDLDDKNSDILMKEQKEWLHKRDLICGDDRGVFDCLETMYRARMLELEAFKNLHPHGSGKSGDGR
jgi:uncharacterized protein YecT (DUF1311 family)